MYPKVFNSFQKIVLGGFFKLYDQLKQKEQTHTNTYRIADTKLAHK